MNTLVHLSYSPWSEKARWALDHHRVEHEREPHVPLVGEVMLRARLKTLRKVTVPILFTDGRVLTDSYEIAEFAERHGSGTPLMPNAQRAAIADYNDTSERILEAGRARITARTLKCDAALKQSVPPPMNRLGPLVLPLARSGARFLQRKYGFDGARDAHHGEVLERALTRLKEDLGSGDYLLGDAFGYADLCMAVALQMISPVPDRYMRLGPDSRVAWRDPELAERFPELLEWRDAMYARHRN